jgi:hypothetical protein
MPGLEPLPYYPQEGGVVANDRAGKRYQVVISVAQLSENWLSSDIRIDAR